MFNFLLDLLDGINLPWGLADQHLVQDDAKRPDISFLGVHRVAEDLWGHVERTTHYWGEDLLVDFDCFGES
jgi:hypothetical protein